MQGVFMEYGLRVWGILDCLRVEIEQLIAMYMRYATINGCKERYAISSELKSV